MLPDLQRLIQLQRLANRAADAQRAVDAIPSRVAALDDQLAMTTATLEAANVRLSEQKIKRRDAEKSLAMVQSRLSRYREQLMAVKTNKEYTAMQHEIATAEHDVQQLEDTVLERMLEIDDLTAAVEGAVRALATTRVEVEQARAALESERSDLEQVIAGASGERAALTETVGARARQLFNTIAEQRGGIAVVEARDGHCTVCNVRLRPQVFNNLLMNSELIQCESCMRILYHDPDGGRDTAPSSDPVR